MNTFAFSVVWPLGKTSAYNLQILGKLIQSSLNVLIL